MSNKRFFRFVFVFMAGGFLFAMALAGVLNSPDLVRDDRLWVWFGLVLTAAVGLMALAMSPERSP
jgi:hypothetical protein